MKKNILNLEGVQHLSKAKQKSISGGLQLIKTILVCTENTMGQPCGPPHCPGECGRFNGEPYCWSY